MDDENPPRRWLGIAAITLAWVCMAPTLIAIWGAIVVGGIEAYTATDLGPGGMEALEPVLIMLAVAALGMLGAAVLAAIGLVLHTIGLGAAVVAYRNGVRIFGPLLIVCHLGMGVVDVLYLGFLLYAGVSIA